MNTHLTVQVPRSPDLNQLIDRFQHKLEPLLFAFQPELVQLQGRMVRHNNREGVLCNLNLHLPTGQLSSEVAAATAQTAFRQASSDLVRQLNKHKQRLRETRPHFKKAAVPRPRPEVAEAGARRRRDLAGYFGSHSEHLLAFVRRQIALRERLGELPAGRLDPAEVLDEVVVAALSSRPSSLTLNRGRWLLLLAAEAIRKLAKEQGERQHGQRMESLEAPMQLASGDAASDDFAEQRADRVRLEDTLASNRASPEETAVAREAMSRLAAALEPLPKLQRHDLVLYLLEGFRPRDLAQLSGRSEDEVKLSLQQAETALHAGARLPDLLQHRLPLELQSARPAGRRGRRARLLSQRSQA